MTAVWQILNTAAYSLIPLFFPPPVLSEENWRNHLTRSSPLFSPLMHADKEQHLHLSLTPTLSPDCPIVTTFLPSLYLHLCSCAHAYMTHKCIPTCIQNDWNKFYSWLIAVDTLMCKNVEAYCLRYMLIHTHIFPFLYVCYFALCWQERHFAGDIPLNGRGSH